jgi:hypothetical protein
MQQLTSRCISIWQMNIKIIVLLTVSNEVLGDIWPLNHQRLLTIQVNSPQLVELIDPNVRFIEELYRVGCITWRQKDDLDATYKTAEKNEKLLHFLKRRSVDAFNNFVDCLNKSKQQPVAEILMESGGKLEDMLSIEPLSITH